MNQPNLKRRRHILRSLRVDEISAVDQPAQAPAGAILQKSNTMSQESIIREALTVHTEGQEPPAGRTAEEYEAAILAVAPLDQYPSENIAEAVARVARNGDPEVTALIFAASRLRDREAASLGKSATAPSPIAEDAERVRKSGSSPRYTRDDYHSAMQEIAKAEARPGEGVAGAFARLVGEGRFDDLYQAAELAEFAEVEAAIEKSAPEDRFYPMLMDMALMRKRQGETIEQAAARLLHEDATVRDAYAAVNGL